MINKIIKGIRDPKRAILYILGTRISKGISDERYLKLKYKLITGKELDFENPKTFNEKLQWLKLYNRKPEYTKMVDKFEVRKYITDRIGEEYLIPLIGVYDSFEEIDFDVLPNQFVLKPNHTSGNVYICKDKSKINYEELKKEINMWLKRRYYWMHREWPYKNVKPKIVCEKYMVDESGVELKDYKMYCFNGEIKLIQVDYDRFNGHKRNLYNREWEYVPTSIKYPSNPDVVIKKPSKLKEMLELASVLSEGHPYVRVDFYSINEKLYFGEITFYPEAGYGKFDPDDLDIEMGNLIKLPKI
ncbi:glycosyl transferase [Bacillus sp. HNR-4]|uniref:ATP-grasp fold amidoligase family protein n=1 Tax=Bacillus sp. HNR-4 TaxID=2796141 RepID=UPI002379B8A8|nr:ATP-grasp fold amidoligase family protein [Bacillus sp. HNR-4]WDL92125.1 glycosyl transferase [Bacillus sp. HNR-4]